MKTCAKFGEDKDDTEYHNEPRNRDGLQSYCKSCKREGTRGYKRPAHKARIGALRKYGLTVPQYDALMVACDRKCMICEADLVEAAKVWNVASVDHNHETGQVRGILCRPCNSALGLFRDSPEILMKAANYLNDNGHYGPKEA